ncbi:MAG: CHAT domain-containing protein [Bacteroidetes bacterium]|nr:CHAT domain-containing protein [Bacteroidota bacterium]
MRSFIVGIFVCILSFSSLAQSWQQLYDEAEKNFNRDWNKSIELLEKALPLVEDELGYEDNYYAQVLNDLGLAYWHTGGMQKAEELFNESLEIKRELYDGQGPEYAASLVNLAGLYKTLGDLNKSRDYFEQALAVYQQAGEEGTSDYAKALNNYGSLYEVTGNYRKAQELYAQSMEIRQSAVGPNHPDYAASLNNLGKIYAKTGDFKKAESYYNQALDIYKNSSNIDQSDYANALDNLGALYEIIGDYGRAERTLLQAMEVRKSFTGRKKTAYAKSLNNLGTLYRKLGNFKNAESYFKQSREIYQEVLGTNNPDYATATNNLANLFKVVGKLDEAEPLYQEAADIYLATYGEFHPRYATALNNLASLYRRKGRFEEAKKLYQKTIEIDKRILGENHPMYATSLNNLAILHSASGNFSEAEPLYQQALGIRRESLGVYHPQYAKSLNNLGLFYLSQDRVKESEPYFSEAIKVQLAQIKSLFPSLSEKEKEIFYNTIRQDQERFNTIALLRKNENPSIIGEMYNNQLATKAILFNATNKMRKNILSSGDQELIIKFNQWRKLKGDLAQYYQLGKIELQKKNINLEELESQANTLEKELSLKSEQFAKETDKKSYTWLDIQKELVPGEAAVELIRFREFATRKSGDSGQSKNIVNFGFHDKVYYAALIVTPQTSGNPQLVLLENGTELEGKFLANYKNSLRFRVEDIYSYDQYWAKIRENIPTTKKVYFSPDGIYNRINLNVLYHTTTGRYVIDEVDIELLTNTKELLDKTVSENQDNQAVMFGNPDYLIDEQTRKKVVRNADYNPSGHPDLDYNKMKNTLKYFVDLPGAQQEILEINKITGQNQWHNQTYLGYQALEETIKSIRNPKVLHIATHGFFSENLTAAEGEFGVSSSNPLFRSGLMMAGSGKTVYDREIGRQTSLEVEDGILTAYEAMNLYLDETDLVVLSACDTGLGEIRNGEGIYGLERAFKVAGAKAIIMSLVKVEDQATKELMTTFYKEWVRIGNKRKAFRNAQLIYREKDPDPYNWGAFVMVGS